MLNNLELIGTDITILFVLESALQERKEERKEKGAEISPRNDTTLVQKKL